LMQMIATGELKDIPAARTCIQTSFPTEIYQANPIDSTIKNRYQAFMKRSSL
ncbi:rhamnulokinase, partial [Enterococcus faecium]